MCDYQGVVSSMFLKVYNCCYAVVRAFCVVGSMFLDCYRMFQMVARRLPCSY